MNGGYLLVPLGTQCSRAPICASTKGEEAAVYLHGSGWVMCLCKQPFTQVSRGATEREHTFIPFLMVMTQKSRLAFPHFPRHYWSGSLVFL